MKLKALFKIVVDVVITTLLLFLMAFMLTGQTLHEWLGATMFIFFVIHHLLNVNWYKKLFQGKYNTLRVIQTTINFLLLFFMIGQMVSGIIMSRHVFAFLAIDSGLSFAREVHLFTSYWGFTLMSCHLGLHWGMIVGMLKKAVNLSKDSRLLTMVLKTLSVLIAGYGGYALIKHKLFSYMLLKSKFAFFDFNQSAISFFCDYLAMMGLFVFITYSIVKLCLYLQTKSRHRVNVETQNKQR